MAILSINRDQGIAVNLVRISTDDSLSTITTNGYLTDQADNIDALNNGALEWEDNDVMLIRYSGGYDLFSRDASNNTFVEYIAGSGLSSTLSDGNIFVGNASNEATGVAVSGDIGIDNTGAVTIANNAVELGMLASGITPSHIIKFAGKESNGGGSATIAITVTGVLATDIVFAQVEASTNAVQVQKVTPSSDTVTVLLSGDPGASTEISYQVLRAAA